MSLKFPVRRVDREIALNISLKRPIRRGKSHLTRVSPTDGLREVVGAEEMQIEKFWR